ncbi:retrovirus-related pol polyprotein from transposon TNT 1-94 [Tanacetum coccineum]
MGRNGSNCFVRLRLRVAFWGFSRLQLLHLILFWGSCDFLIGDLLVAIDWLYRRRAVGCSGAKKEGCGALATMKGPRYLGEVFLSSLGWKELSHQVDLTGDEDPTDEDGDIGVSVSLGVEIFLEGKKSQESNIGDSDNTGDGGKTAGRAIITWGGRIASLISESEGTICRDELLILKQAKLDAVTFQIQNTKLIKLNHALQEQLKKEKKINEKWLTSSKKVSQCINEQIPHQKKKVLGGELLTDSSSKKNENENLFILAFMGYDQEMVPKTKEWVKRLNPNRKLTNFNTGRILVPKSQAVNESLKTSNTPESSKNPEAEFLTLLPPLKILQGASPSSKPETHDSSNESVLGTVTVSESKQTTPSVPTEVKDTKQESKLNELTKLVQMLIDEKVNSDQKTQESNSKIQKAESSKSVDSSKISQDSKPKVQSTSSSKSLRPKPIQKPQLKMVENQNDVKVKQIKIDNGTEFRNHKFKSFCDEKGISQNFSSPYTLEQNDVAERKNKTLIDTTRTMLNGAVLFKNFWTDAIRIACYTQNRSIIVKRHDKTSYEIFKERIPNISYFYVFGCHVFIHNHKDHLGKFDAKADDGYFLGYSSVSKAFRVYNTRRQQLEETYHVTFHESMEAIRFTNTSVDEIRIDDSSRYPPDEFQEDDPSRQYQVDSNVSYYIIPYGRPPNSINTEGTHEQNIQNDQMITQPTDVPLGNNTKVSGSITEPFIPDVSLSHITNWAFTSSYPVPQDRWSRDQHIELVNIIGNLGEGMLTRSMAAKLITALASECLFADFLSEIEPKKVSEALKHPRWIDAMQEELN